MILVALTSHSDADDMSRSAGPACRRARFLADVGSEAGRLKDHGQTGNQYVK